jgi:hypothetical protein
MMSSNLIDELLKKAEEKRRHSIGPKQPSVLDLF